MSGRCDTCKHAQPGKPRYDDPPWWCRLPGAGWKWVAAREWQGGNQAQGCRFHEPAEMEARLASVLMDGIKMEASSE